MRRFGQVLGIATENIPEYTRLHAAVWPSVLAMITACLPSRFSGVLRVTIHATMPTSFSPAARSTSTYTQEKKNDARDSERAHLHTTK